MPSNGKLGSYLSVRVQVGWGDCDPAGIVFYPRFYAWMDTVSHALAREMGIAREAMLPPGADLLGFPVVGTQAQYVSPARMDDVLEVRAWVARVGRTSLSLRHEILRIEADGTETLIVRGREDRVFIVQGPDGLQARELTPRMREALARFADPQVESEPMDFSVPEEHAAIRGAVRELCGAYPDAYWRNLDRTHAYPTEFVRALTEAGWLAALIPAEYGGPGLGIAEAAIILEEINRAGGNAAAAHAQMYIMGTVLRHGSPDQKRRYLPGIARGELRLQAFGVTEPDAGSETTRLKTTAVRRGDCYVVNGQKVWTSRAEHSDLLLLLARTTPYDELTDKTRGLSVFLVDLQRAVAAGQIEIRPIETMLNHHTTELFIQDLEVPAENLIGQEDMGFRYIIDGWNAERILIAAESIGDGRWFVGRASKYASERVVFGRPIGANQGVQFPIAQAHARLEAADLLRHKAAWLFDTGRKCGAEANMAKLLAAQAAWDAANACLDTHGGYGFAVEFDVERKFRETRLYSVAPINNNLVLAYVGQHVLGMPRSY